VINVDTPGDYCRNADMFHLFETTKPAMKLFNELFGVIVVVTNQRGVSKGLMTEQDLKGIHAKMLGELIPAGGRIDKIYYCMDLDAATSTHRKPKPGMAFDAKNDFPQIDFTKSIMIGNNISDMQFGKTVGMTTIYIDDRAERAGVKTVEMDFIFNNLLEFATILTNK
jgi:histidinol-phosphate phosphatase family protein